MNRTTCFKSKNLTAWLLALVLLVATVMPANAQRRLSGSKAKQSKAAERARERERERLIAIERRTPRPVQKIRFNEKGEQLPDVIQMNPTASKTSLELMTEAEKFAGQKTTRQLLSEKGLLREMEGPDRSKLRQNPNAPAIAEYPQLSAKEKMRLGSLAPTAPQTVGLQFTAATLADTGAFPPDTMGAVGPSQFVAFINGRLRTFTKAGVADGVLNIDPDNFFSSVITPVGGSVVASFTSDPNVRYDRLTGRWFLTIIDVPCTNATCTTTAANRFLIAVSDAASNAAITPATTWTFFQFTASLGTDFADYPSLGVDASALYVGMNMFTSAGAFIGTNGYVINKAALLSGGPVTVSTFANLASGVGAGPFSPRGVDNPDPANTGAGALGYFIGVDNATFSTLVVRRVTNPGGTPAISANISLTVPTTTFPNRVTHSGNTGGANGGLDALDDRLYAAVMRNGRLWTAHNFRTTAAGVASTATNSRNSIRWYELQNLSTTPTLVQSGTVFDNAATLAAARQYWIPSIAVNGQGHAAIGSSTAGTPYFIDAFTIGRLAGSTLGTMNGSPGSLLGYTTSTTAYNPAADPGGTAGRRWGDYSYVSVDPLDDMTMWTIQQFCDSTNSYGVRVAKLLSTAPASIADGPVGGQYSVLAGQSSVNVTISGTSTGGSGWYDPGADLGGNARPFNHITVSVSGTNVVVNSVTYNSPTSVTLNLNTVGANLSGDQLVPTTVRDITITNPDGQSVTRSGILVVSVPTAAGLTVGGRVMTSAGVGVARVTVSITDSNGVVRTTTTNTFGNYTFENVRAGELYTLAVQGGKLQFNESTRVLNVTDNITDADFVALTQ